MATYIIGDLHGCYEQLLQLLEKIQYRSTKDELWFTGDIINRGPNSLECLRFVKEKCESNNAKIVLGNHDLHLIATYAGFDKFQSKSDTIDQILIADDHKELINWLRCQPLIIRSGKVVLVHAGIPPQWTIEEALQHSEEVSNILSGDNWQIFAKQHLWGNEPYRWSEKLNHLDKLRYTINALSRLRYCDFKGTLEFKLKSNPTNKGSQHADYKAWYSFEDRKNIDHEIFFGHWSTLGAISTNNVHALDTGCLWGGTLTAYHLEKNLSLSIECKNVHEI